MNVCEEMRHGEPKIDITDMLKDLEKKYNATMAAIDTLDANDAE